MKIGGKAWYVQSLREKAIRVTITGIEVDTLNRIVYVKSVDRHGVVYNDYVSLFSDTRPIQYGF